MNGKKIHEVSEYMIQGDEDFLEMMFANLIKNAIDASPERADVSVSVDMDKINGKRFHVIDIHNLGIVPQDIREKFFEPYSTSGKKEGTGLGTYSSFLITKAHKGHIHFTTSDEKGTNVIVELPEQINSGNDLE
jgi:signal transduction histidine kinase